MLNYLYLLSQDINNDYDTFDSVIVCAPDEETARNIHPSGKDCEFDRAGHTYGAWVNEDQKNKIKISKIGIAENDIEVGIVIASFNAG